MSRTSTTDIAKAIHESLKGGSDVAALAKNTVAFLEKKKMLSKRDLILEKLEKLYNAEAGVVNAVLFTAASVDESFKDKVKAYIKDKYNDHQVNLEEKIQQDLVGGFKIKIDDEVLDATIFNKLKELQAHLIR